jgi:ATP synthase protein I
MNAQDKEKSVARQLFEASTVGIHLVLCTFAGLAIGYGLDVLFGTSFLKFVFLFMGIVAGFVELFRIAKKQGGNRDAGTSAGNDPEDH